MRDAIRLLVVSLAALTVACASPLDTGDLETQLADQLHDRFPTATWAVDCPDDVQPEAGSTFRCQATANGGGGLVIAVHQDDDQGTVTWSVASVGTGD